MRTVSSSSADRSTGRIPSIDAARTLAIVAVVAIHCDPFAAGTHVYPGVAVGDLVDLLCRFAVPFFFVTAGYLFGKKCLLADRRLDALGAFAIRLAGLVMFWYAFYVVWPFDWAKAIEQGVVRTAYWSAHSLFSDLGSVLAGPRAHLWFLMALLIGSTHVFVMALVGSRALLIAYFSTLYVVGLCQGAYSVVLDLATPHVLIPANLFLSPLPVALGWCLAAGWIQVSRGMALLMFVAGTVMTFLEAWVLFEAYEVPFQNHDFLIGTPFQALGLLSLLRTYPLWANRTVLPAWGRYTLGVYAAHVAVMEVLGTRMQGGIVWDFMGTPAVYALTLLVVILLAKWKRLRPFVT